ncbi:MAG: zinc-ribbon and DUF3426 domain-containing protein [Burkholderiales bacterium]|nr:zinc-ribbon and DUF3426 domain-containing protein [Burkholderiales bacterium]
MSLATRCTHCGTIFKVVQDQLKVSEGWVRCGRCQGVFNALPALFDLDTEAPPPRQVPAPPAPAPEPPAWSTTQPSALAPPTPISAHTPLTASDLALNGASLPAATEFDLDTSVDLSDDAASTAPAANAPLDGLRLSSDPRPWQADPRDDLREAPSGTAPETAPEDLPSTDEADALESRYLLPSRDARPARRRGRGPEFADAQFPSDAMFDEHDAWGALNDEPASLPPTAPEPDAAASPEALPSGAKTPQPAPPSTPPSPHAAPEPLRDDPSIPTTLPSRFGEDFVPEQAVQPPSQRRGRPGTRGRAPTATTPEFMRRAQRQAFWRHPATRGALLTALLGLAALLALQLGHHFRDWIAAYHPDSRPLLNSWCERMGCTLAAPLRLDALQVDSATLVRTSSEGADRYRLTVSVNNRADIDLAWPHIDLTLTDESGGVLARRAFAPSDARVLQAEGRPTTGLPAAAPKRDSTTLQWTLRMPDLNPAGYTAELFYP